NWVNDKWRNDKTIDIDRAGIPYKKAIGCCLDNLKSQYGYTEIIEPQQKVTRYIVSNSKTEAGLLVKDFDDGRKVSVLANTMIEPVNIITVENAKSYDINYDFYIKSARKIVESITPS